MNNMFYSALLVVLAEQMRKVIFEWDFAENKIISTSDFDISVEMVHPEDVPIFQNIFATMLTGNNIENVRLRIKDAEGVYYWCVLSGVVINDDKGKPYRAIGSLENINDRVIEEESLQQKAKKDQLTGLFNKITTENLIKQAILEYDNVNESSALMIIDIDNFKDINDRLGHLSGDIILSSLADKLKMAFRTNDIIGRMGGDEFFVFMKNVVSADIVIAKAKDINKAFRNTYREDSTSCTVSASVGIAFFPAHGDNFNTLYKNADIALYAAKEAGKDTFAIYDGQARANYQSTRTEIDVRGNVPQKNFKENRIEYLFKLLYSASDTHAIQTALELITDHFSFSRGYIFEINHDAKNMSNTYEWCKSDIAPEILNLQKIPLSEVTVAIEHLVNNGKFAMKSLDDVSESERAILEPQGIKSMFHFGIFDKGRLMGFVGFDDCVHERTLTAAELDELSTICNLLAVFVSRKTTP